MANDQLYPKASLVSDRTVAHMSHMLATDAKEYQVPLYKCCTDLTKAYDKVNRELL